MNWVDIAIIFVIAVTSLYSFMWGFVRQLLLMVCFAAGLYVALTYNGWVYEQFTSSWVSSETIAKIVAGGLPGGALCGKRPLMSLLAFRDDPDWESESDEEGQTGKKSKKKDTAKKKGKKGKKA